MGGLLTVPSIASNKEGVVYENVASITDENGSKYYIHGHPHTTSDTSELSSSSLSSWSDADGSKYYIHGHHATSDTSEPASSFSFSSRAWSSTKFMIANVSISILPTATIGMIYYFLHKRWNQRLLLKLESQHKQYLLKIKLEQQVQQNLLKLKLEEQQHEITRQAALLQEQEQNRQKHEYYQMLLQTSPQFHRLKVSDECHYRQRRRRGQYCCGCIECSQHESFQAAAQQTQEAEKKALGFIMDSSPHKEECNPKTTITANASTSDDDSVDEEHVLFATQQKQQIQPCALISFDSQEDESNNANHTNHKQVYTQHSSRPSSPSSASMSKTPVPSHSSSSPLPSPSLWLLKRAIAQANNAIAKEAATPLKMYHKTKSDYQFKKFAIASEIP